MADVLVIGGGVAGAAAAAFLTASGARVTVLEAEDAPDRHSTGRSAALWSEYVGGPAVRALTRASRAFLAEPPPPLGVGPLLAPRGMVAVAGPGEEHLVAAALAAADDAQEPVREIDVDRACALAPLLAPGAATRAVHRPGVLDLDVAALHQGLLGALRRGGGELVCRAAVTALARDGGGWRVRSTAGEHRAGVVVDAAGAWADDVARLAGAAPRGLVARRRTACVVTGPAVTGPAALDAGAGAALTDLAATFYVRPESGAVLVSPMDATPVPAGDVRPDPLDVARGIEAAQRFVAVPLRHVRRAWAGLRTSTREDLPVVGPDPSVEGFFWLAGLGGHGIQTAPAVGALLAAAVSGEVSPSFRSVHERVAESLRPR